MKARKGLVSASYTPLGSAWLWIHSRSGSADKQGWAFVACVINQYVSSTQGVQFLADRSLRTGLFKIAL